MNKQTRKTTANLAISFAIFLVISLSFASCKNVFGTSFSSETPELKLYDVASVTAISTNPADTTKKGFILKPDEKDAFFSAVASAQKVEDQVAGIYLVQFHLKTGGTVEIGASKSRLFKAKTGVYALSESSPTFAEYFKK